MLQPRAPLAHGHINQPQNQSNTTVNNNNNNNAQPFEYKQIHTYLRNQFNKHTNATSAENQHNLGQQLQQPQNYTQISLNPGGNNNGNGGIANNLNNNIGSGISQAISTSQAQAMDITQ